MNASAHFSLDNSESILPLPVIKTDEDLDQALRAFHAVAKEVPEANRTLEAILNTASKNLPAYLKIVKGHLEQLATVLRLDSHQNQQLNYTQLPQPLQQLVHLFQHLDEEDLSHIEWLSRETQSWKNNLTATSDKSLKPLTEEV
ncbi:MAG: hypothetical protein RLZ35_897 [Pseudomonadota bacterium]|jgi:predicted ribonuclease YlaK